MLDRANVQSAPSPPPATEAPRPSEHGVDPVPVISSRAATLLVAVTIVGLGVGAWWLQRGFIFGADEWNILTGYHDGHHLDPYNGHLSLIPTLIYRVFASTFGVSSYRPFGTFGLVVFLTLLAVFFATHRRRVDPMLCAAATLAVGLSSVGEANLLYGFMLPFTLPTLALIVIWWLIRFDDVRHDLWAAGALVVALATSNVGVVVAVALAVELVAARAPFRRFARFAPVAVLWLAWFVVFHEPSPTASWGARFAYAWDLAVAILAGFTAGWTPGAVPVAIVVCAVLGLAIRRGAFDAHVFGVFAGLVFFIGLSAYSRAGDILLNPPDTHRYVWFGDFLLIAALLWCARDRRVHRAVVPVTLAVVAVGVIGLVPNIRYHRAYVVGSRQRIQPLLAEAEAAGPAADRTRTLPLNMIPVSTGAYLDMVAHVGSPIADVAFDDLGSPAVRARADRFARIDLGVHAEKGRSRPSCPTAWRAVVPRSDSEEFAIRPGSTLFVRTGDSDGTALYIRRFADEFSKRRLVTLFPDSSLVLALPDDAGRWPWRISFQGHAASIELCEP